ncbi:MBL fold metallo-hydrolase [Geminicoccus roseus]|uniref:MBL fold metallo-hydrolase n=1 Tax=Geminicoccus roseus TaxID=404900 RepID=UPI0003FFB008|nr:MBL fold metallo-hydrolase [Geminicoccus roseus]
MTTSNHVRLSRRGFCLCCLASGTFAATAGWLSPAEVFAKARNIVDLIRADAATAPIHVHALRGDVFVLEGSGGNIGVLVRPEGKLLVDAGITASRPRIVEALDGLGPAPVTHLINTHWHFDHADGNEWLHEAGATILAHANTRTHLMSAQRVADWDFDFPPSPGGAVPTELISSDQTLDLLGRPLAPAHHAAAHTDGDVTITFEDADILHAGDIYWNGIYPFIDYSTGGGIDGMIAASEAILEKVGGSTIIVPGHGHPVSNRAELQSYRDMLVAIRENVARLKQQGRSLDETIAASPTAAFDDQWGQFVITPAFFTRLVYQGV